MPGGRDRAGVNGAGGDGAVVIAWRRWRAEEMGTVEMPGAGVDGRVLGHRSRGQGFVSHIEWV